MVIFILSFLGILFISSGAVSWAIGSLIPNDRITILIGAIFVAAAGFLYRWQRLQPQPHKQSTKVNYNSPGREKDDKIC